MTALLTEPEAAARLRMSPRLLREKRSLGEIRYVALSARKIAYRPEDCDEFVSKQLKVDRPCRTTPKPKRFATGGNVVPFSQLDRR